MAKAMAGLEIEEKGLTQEVPQLLETMNRTSSEVNAFEQQVSDAQARYKRLLEQWSRLYEDLRSQHGSAIDRVKPYFDGAQAFNAASQRVQAVAREFSAAASRQAQAKAELKVIEERLAYGAHKVQLGQAEQDSLSRSTVHVLRCRQERDRREVEYSKALGDYQAAQKHQESWKAQIGETSIKRTLPCFKQLQMQQNALAAEQQRINSFTERAQCAKTAYNNAIKELDRINVSVHEARKAHQQRARIQSLHPPEQSPEALVPPEIAVEPPGNCDVFAYEPGIEGIEDAWKQTLKRRDAVEDVADGPFA